MSRIPARPLVLAALLAACSSDAGTTLPGPVTFANTPCSQSGTLSLTVTQTALVDCSNGGSTLTLAGNGASYIIVPQFPTDQGVNDFVQYSVATGTLATASASGRRVAASLVRDRGIGLAPGSMPTTGPGARQRAWDRALRARAQRKASQGGFQGVSARVSAATRSPSAQFSPPTQGSTRAFHVLSSFDPDNPTWTTVTATLIYAGTNLLLYVDNATPANGFTPSQLSNFGLTFDQTFYALVQNAFGPPSDIDQNGAVVMLMSPVVNADTPAATCNTDGFVAGFFDSDDFDGPSDPNSNQGEIFYSIVPDPAGTVSCAHSVADVDGGVPATFVHELQHLIYFSQHAIVNHQPDAASWLDEGLSIVAEELGSLYYEQKCPPPACRTTPTQLFPDSSQGFIAGVLFDSYEYALVPVTASLTLHNDSEQGFSWRGGDWLLARWLGDQYGANVFKQLELGPGDGVANIAQASARPFPSLLADFGLALYTDSFPGLPRATAPAADRFVSRNLRQIWARYAATTPSLPFTFPLQLFQITSDTTSFVMNPGAMTYYRLDTPANTATVTIRFSGPGGVPLAAALHPQMSVMRLPAGQ